MVFPSFFSRIFSLSDSTLDKQMVISSSSSRSSVATTNMSLSASSTFTSASCGSVLTNLTSVSNSRCNSPDLLPKSIVRCHQSSQGSPTLLNNHNVSERRCSFDNNDKCSHKVGLCATTWTWNNSPSNDEVSVSVSDETLTECTSTKIKRTLSCAEQGYDSGQISSDQRKRRRRRRKMYISCAIALVLVIFLVVTLALVSLVALGMMSRTENETLTNEQQSYNNNSTRLIEINSQIENNSTEDTDYENEFFSSNNFNSDVLSTRGSSSSTTVSSTKTDFTTTSKERDQRRKSASRLSWELLNSNNDKTRRNGNSNVRGSVIPTSKQDLSDDENEDTEDAVVLPAGMVYTSDSNINSNNSDNNKRKKSCCRTEKYTQVIRRDGCEPLTIVNKMCFGQCVSVWVPGLFSSFPVCKPSRSTWKTVTLTCGEFRDQTRRVRVEKVKRCSCMEIESTPRPLDESR